MVHALLSRAARFLKRKNRRRCPIREQRLRPKEEANATLHSIHHLELANDYGDDGAVFGHADTAVGAMPRPVFEQRQNLAAPHTLEFEFSIFIQSHGHRVDSPLVLAVIEPYVFHALDKLPASRIATPHLYIRMKRNPSWLTISDVARLLGCSVAGLCHHIYSGKIPKPTAVAKTRRYYTPADFVKIKAYWDARVPAGCSRFTESDVAEMRLLWLGGMRQCDIAALFDAGQENVSQLLSGVLLPGWRGGGCGHGRKNTAQTRRRNLGQ
jgi:hypothetical protein